MTAASLRAKLLDETQVHPGWCTNATTGDRCDSHYSEPASVPATAGDFILNGGAALFPVTDVSAILRANGQAGVTTEASDPTANGQVKSGSVESVYTPTQARDLGFKLIAAAQLVDPLTEEQIADLLTAALLAVA